MKLKSRNKVSAQFSMSSMTDLVFLLLIFFIIVSTMVTPHAVDVDLPTGTVPSENKPLKVVVEIDKDLNHVVAGDAVSIEQLTISISNAFLAEPNYSPQKKKTIILRVDKTVQSESLVNVLVIAKQNDWSIAIATKPG